MTRNSVDENIEHNLSLPSHFDRLCLKGFKDHVVNQIYHKWLVLKVDIELFKSATQVAPNFGCQYHQGDHLHEHLQYVWPTYHLAKIPPQSIP